MAEVLLCQGTALALPLRDASVHTVCTSPPYWGLRSYGIGAAQGEIGQEETIEAYVAAMVQVFREVWRVLRPEGTLWIVLGDSYNAAGRNGHGTRIGYKQGTNRASATGQDACRPSAPGLKEKDLCMMPARVAIALQQSGWYLRSAITWCKSAPMPESVSDRPSRATEMIFLFAKQPHYFYDSTAVRVSGGNGWHGSSFTSGHDVATKPGLGQQARTETTGHNLWDYWVLGPEPTGFQHYACMPTALVRRCLLAGAPTQVCAACAAPYRRVVERQRLLDGHTPVSGAFSRPEEPFRIPPNGVGHWRYTTQTTDHGFEATCRCDAGSAPSVVLDPFAGSGTVGLVARDLGHHAVLCDLSWPYLHDIARERLGLAALHAWQHGQQAQDVSYSDLPLFGG